MSVFEWPEEKIPLPSARFDLNNESTVLRSRMETGRFRQRRRFTAEHEAATLVFDLIDSEFTYFKAIWKHKLLSGSGWFKMRLPIGAGESLTLCEVRFTANYRARHATHENWSVTAPIEFKESKTISEDILDLDIIYDGDFDRFVNQMNILANDTFPYDWEYNPTP